jgi:hypothetical protein
MTGLCVTPGLRTAHGRRGVGLDSRIRLGGIFAFAAATATAATVTTVTTATMTEQVHGDHPASEENQNPIIQNPLHAIVSFYFSVPGSD